MTDDDEARLDERVRKLVKHKPVAQESETGGEKLVRTTLIGLFGAIVVGLLTHSLFFGIFMFAFYAGGDLFVAYWRSLDEKPVEKPE
jgi:hypothetical protein